MHIVRVRNLKGQTIFQIWAIDLAVSKHSNTAKWPETSSFCNVGLHLGLHLFRNLELRKRHLFTDQHIARSQYIIMFTRTLVSNFKHISRDISSTTSCVSPCMLIYVACLRTVVPWQSDLDPLRCIQDWEALRMHQMRQDQVIQMTIRNTAWNSQASRVLDGFIRAVTISLASKFGLSALLWRVCPVTGLWQDFWNQASIAEHS